MTKKINDNVAMMILENAEMVNTLNTNAYLEISFQKILCTERGDKLCKICVIYWKAIDSYSIIVNTVTDMSNSCFNFNSAIETVDFLGKIFSDEVIDLSRIIG